MRAKRATFTFEWTEVNQNAKNGPFWRVFENLKLVVKQCYQTGLIGQKLVENAKMPKFQMRHFRLFSNTVNP